MATITRDNFNNAGSKLVRSSQSRNGGIPDGNVFIDTPNDVVELMDVSEVPTLSADAGSANALTTVDKVDSLALYFFLLKEVELDPSLQKYRFMMDAVPNRMGKLVGATAFLNGVTLAAGDEAKISNSGFTEFALDGSISSVFHGVKALNLISPTGQPFYQLVATPVTEATRQAATPVNFSNVGKINDVIKTYTNGGADLRSYALILGVRDFGYTIGETDSVKTGITELGAYSQGYGIGNTLVPEISVLTEADVYGAGIVAPYTGLAFNRDNPVNSVSVGVFNEGVATFTDRITNTGGATLLQVRAWLDKLMQQDVDVNSGTDVVTFLPKRAEPLYNIDSQGRLVTRKGLMIEGLSASDQQGVVFTDDTGSTFTYPFAVGIEITLSGAWYSDTNQFYRIMYANGGGAGDDFDTSGAITATATNADANNANSLLMSGDKTDSRITSTPDVDGNHKLTLTYDYDGNSEASLSSSIDKSLILRIGGGTTSKSKVVPITVKRVATIPVDATTDSETN